MRRSTILLGVAAFVAMPFVARAPVEAGAAETGTVRAVVKYQTPSGNEPLIGVEVWLGIPSAPDTYGCTDARGVVRFRDVPAGVDLLSATGPSLERGCANAGFLNPRTGKEMTSVAWEGHHGELGGDAFAVSAGQTLTLRYVARTPDQHGRLCEGVWTTWVGTSGADRFSGTSGMDVINARGGDDRVRGGGDLDFICGGTGDDSLIGGGGPDWLFGQAGDDELAGGPGRDSVFGGPGRDRCEGGRESDCEP